jgi:outer membrane protein OmpA-like peptidoglycan-associated protein
MPVVLGMITRRVSDTGLSASSLTGLFSSMRSFWQEAPAGLTSALGVDSGRPAVGSYDAETARPVVGTYDAKTAASPVVGSYETEPKRGTPWWLWALPLLALLGLLVYFFGRTPDRVQTARADLGRFIERQLPSGIKLNFPMNGIESRLIAFIEDPARRVDNETWFSFDRLEFETDSAELRGTSNEQLRNIAEILKAYPQVNADDAYNVNLSSQRANNTLNALANLGIDRSRMSAEGYGKEHPVADNATPEGRQRNRRIDILVTKK